MNNSINGIHLIDVSNHYWMHNNYNDHKTECYPSGKIQNEEYLLDGRRHRKDGPAITWYYESGQVKEIGYYINRLFHRLDGPAVIEYDEAGNVVSEEYYINGQPVQSANLQIQKMVDAIELEIKENIERIHSLQEDLAACHRVDAMIKRKTT